MSQIRSKNPLKEVIRREVFGVLRKIKFLNMRKKRWPNWLRKVPQEKGWYLAGFVDGEGSFNVSLRKRNDYRLSWQIVMAFNVSQRDITNLFLLKKYLGCGKIKKRKDGLYYFEVVNQKSIFERVIPFFRKFYFLSASKKRNFSIFRKIANLVEEGSHLNKDGLREIIELREKLNTGRGRKRKYNQRDVFTPHHQKSIPHHFCDRSGAG